MNRSIQFEGRPVPFIEDDTLASALYRSGVRVFTRSLKHHRPRGLYCASGDCANCLLTVDGVPGLRACTTPCRDGMSVRREGGWPSTEHDLLRVADILRRFLPVGFYYKTFIHPRVAWPIAERVIRRATGIGRLPSDQLPVSSVVRHLRTDVLVVGAGRAGLEAALAAARGGERVVICDEGAIAEAIAPGPTRNGVAALASEVRATPAISVLERHTAIGLYDGPMVPLSGASELVEARPDRVVIATGALEMHPVFPGNDLTGIWLGRGAARLAGVHGVCPGKVAVVVAGTAEGFEHLATLRAAGVRIAAAIVPADLAGELSSDVEALIGYRIVRAEGRSSLRAVVVAPGPSAQPGAPRKERKISCDTLMLSVGLAPRDDLLRMALKGEPVEGVGDVVAVEPARSFGDDGVVCPCEDVSLHDLERAWEEGFRSSEILKRYSTATMGPCQGALCARLLTCFVRDRVGQEPGSAAVSSDRSSRTTARPPARPVAIESLAAAYQGPIIKRTALHQIHRSSSARVGPSGGWFRPFAYGDHRDEYRAVRERVSIMDVGTLSKFLVAGPDAIELLERVFPCRVGDLVPGRTRYVLALDEAGYVMDDGLLCALDDGRYYLTSTSSGGARMEAWLRNWSDRFDLEAYVVDRSAELGAILVAGPRSRELLAALSDDPLDGHAIPYPGHREIEVAGVPCRAIRTGFVGELAFELHHPHRLSIELWEALIHHGRPFDLLPHGLDALEILRLEKGHVYVGQDTLPDDTPAKLGMGWAVAMGKPWFVGKPALERLGDLPLDRRLFGLTFPDAPGAAFDLRGMPLEVSGRIVGRVTSAEYSASLGEAVGLGWLRAPGGAFPDEARVAGRRAVVTKLPFYDPEGVRVRA